MSAMREVQRNGYRHGGRREPRPQHLSWDGLMLSPDHPFRETPPTGWGCNCYVVGARTERAAIALGGKPGLALSDDRDRLDPRTGAPAGIDRGWAHAPGASVIETVALGARKIAQVGSDFGAGMAGIIDRHWPLWLADVPARGSHRPGLLGVMPRDVIEALARRGIAPASAEIMVKPGLVSGPKALRHETAGDALPPEQWLTLPRSLRKPSAVLLDPSSGRLLFLVGCAAGQGQLVVSLDYLQKKSKANLNLAVSACRPSMAGLLSRLAGGLIEVLLGALG